METKVTLDGRGVACIYKVYCIASHALAPRLGTSRYVCCTQGASAVPPMLWFPSLLCTSVDVSSQTRAAASGAPGRFFLSPGVWEPDLSSLSTLSPTPYAAVSTRFCLVETIHIHLLFLETPALHVTSLPTPRYHLFFTSPPRPTSHIHHLSSFT